MLTDPVDRLLSVAASRPRSIAVETDGVGLSYADFLTRCRAIAAVCAGAGEHPRVLIHLRQSADAYAAMFGSLMAGGFYSPVNLDHPEERQKALFRQFDPAIVVGDETSSAIFGSGVPVLDVNELPANTLDDIAPAHDLAYVMFTSGSTGEPKGVMIGREALAHYIDWAIGAMGVTAQDRWSQHPNIGFDLSVLDIYGALCAGAALVPLTDRRDRLLPGEAIRRHRLTIWNSVPSVIDLMRKARQVTCENLATLRVMTFCGEPLFKEHLDAVFAARPDLTVHNTYGPTEATVSFTLLKLDAENYPGFCDKSVALGDAIPGMELYLTDESGVTGGDEGEIAIVGPQVARGYWMADGLTAKAFRDLDVGGRTERAYFTGDWAYRSGGQLYFANRIDRQVKIHGHRLELDEVDAALRLLGARAACTVLSEGALISLVEVEQLQRSENWQERLRALLPEYAIPARIETVSALPRNANDKIDVSAVIKAARALVVHETTD